MTIAVALGRKATKLTNKSSDSEHGHNVSPNFFCHGNLQRSYRKMTIKWSFSYNKGTALDVFKGICRLIVICQL